MSVLCMYCTLKKPMHNWHNNYMKEIFNYRNKRIIPASNEPKSSLLDLGDSSGVFDLT